MTSPYGLQQGQMQSIINQTSEAIGQMTTLNAGVQARAGDILAHADSDAGRILQDRLNTWNGDFKAIVDAITELNGKVAQWMQTSVKTGGDATAGAGAGR